MILAASCQQHESDELLDAWVGWHKISVPMKDKYARLCSFRIKALPSLV